jgi:N12 class adenine-specific DNA methylase
VLITSYEVCIIDRRHLEKYKWSYLIVDEGQRVKNRNCRLIRELKCLDTQNRLLLSGTPIQNTLEELWSLLNFVNPVSICGMWERESEVSNGFPNHHTDVIGEAELYLLGPLPHVLFL